MAYNSTILTFQPRLMGNVWNFLSFSMNFANQKVPKYYVINLWISLVVDWSQRFCSHNLLQLAFSISRFQLFPEQIVSILNISMKCNCITTLPWLTVSFCWISHRLQNGFLLNTFCVPREDMPGYKYVYRDFIFHLHFLLMAI